MKHFAALDSLRGICAILVAIRHFPSTNSFFNLPFFAHSFLFVDFFFVLSGFVIHQNYGHRIIDFISAKTFIIRRIARLWPLHIATLVGVVLLEALQKLPHLQGYTESSPFAEGPFETIRSLLSNAFLLHGLGFEKSPIWNEPSWSISTEFWAYVAFVGFAFLGPKLQRMSVALLMIAMPLMIARNSWDYMNTTTDFGMARCLYGFGAGIITSWVSSGCNHLSAVSRTLLTIIQIAVTFITVIFVSTASNGALTLLAPFVFSVSALAFVADRGLMADILQRRFFLSLGAWSYSIYMLHYPAQVALRGALKILGSVFQLDFVHSVPRFDGVGMEQAVGRGEISGALFTFGMIACVVLLSALTHRLIEVPWREHGRNYSIRIANT
ncbi:MAG: acyltransferase [Pseudomonadota bacterium]